MDVKEPGAPATYVVTIESLVVEGGDLVAARRLAGALSDELGRLLADGALDTGGALAVDGRRGALSLSPLGADATRHPDLAGRDLARSLHRRWSGGPSGSRER
jgi:hypothetical protein